MLVGGQHSRLSCLFATSVSIYIAGQYVGGGPAQFNGAAGCSRRHGHWSGGDHSLPRSRAMPVHCSQIHSGSYMLCVPTCMSQQLGSEVGKANKSTTVLLLTMYYTTYYLLCTTYYTSYYVLLTMYYLLCTTYYTTYYVLLTGKL